MRALVTGATGFAGKYLVYALQSAGHDVFACAGPNDAPSAYLPFDLENFATMQSALEASRPDVVFHLAAQTFVPQSLAAPEETYRSNAMGTALLARAVREYGGGDATPRIVFASSAEVYGVRASGDFPLSETCDPRPANPYAASKAAAEALLLGQARSLGLNVVIARAFNHIGPGQSDRFVVPAFAGQLAAIARGGEPVLLVGNLEAARDFLDVRDVVAAYLALARDGESGSVYNVCSEHAVKIRDVLRELMLIAGVPVEVREDPARMRPSDVPLFVGSAAKLRARTGWAPKIPLRTSLREIYEAAYAAAS
ncbi:MAG: GDP-mannose 4,6-dehydratase [Candidatus Eremiobacteraeota bacterium]|nr:GDP-mannose 4,6-dehydratase [Candidatus Eremiobacteraeota bacterium]